MMKTGKDRDGKKTQKDGRMKIRPASLQATK